MLTNIQILCVQYSNGDTRVGAADDEVGGGGQRDLISFYFVS